ncbi:hypothetical protein NA78x_003488 [Anatilimnocola sp. NA78]|uniref:helix-turn-helix domain-containing protein n=1 Tax=Anatilimnocola sp. NA78 TaxID=3415683 RepID=UPI003CE4F6CD
MPAKKKTVERLEGSWEQIAEAYQRGMSIEQIANFYGCSDTSIRKLLKQHSIEIRRPGGSRKQGSPSTAGF